MCRGDHRVCVSEEGKQVIGSLLKGLKRVVNGEGV